MESDVGLVAGVFSITVLLVRPFAGLGSDRLGSKRLIVVGSLFLFITPVLYTLTTAVPSLLLVRLLHGAGWALASTACMAFVAEVAPIMRRGEAMGFYGMFTNAAIALGPAVIFLVGYRRKAPQTHDLSPTTP